LTCGAPREAIPRTERSAGIEPYPGDEFRPKGWIRQLCMVAFIHIFQNGLRLHSRRQEDWPDFRAFPGPLQHLP